MRFANRTSMLGVCGQGNMDRSRLKQFMSTTAISTAVALAAMLNPAFAQSAPKAAQTAADKAEVEEVVVTGTRIVREGYEAPTPLSVLGADAIAQNAGPSLMSVLQTMPALSGSYGSTGAISTAQGNVGLNTANLRALGGGRTLVLLDGQRVVGASYSGVANSGSFPQQLISRVDVVTGGASAVYGSDAVAGVINFVLDRKFTGVKAEISAGVTNYGDDKNYKIDLSTGFGFADDRGHILLSGEHLFNAGIQGNANRPWAHVEAQQLTNPAYTATNGLPQQIWATSNAAIATMTPGGVVASGPLKGTAFGAGGTPFQFKFGSVYSNPYMVGGDTAISNLRQYSDLDATSDNSNLFTRVSYDITDNINAFAQWNFSQNHARATLGAINVAAGTADSPVIKTDNAYLPASVRAAMIANNVTQLILGTANFDAGFDGDDDLLISNMFAAGLEGKFDAFGTTWSWNATYTNGRTMMKTFVFNPALIDRYVLATDAVVNPATGQIVCRITLTNPSDPCRPWNAMGIGVNDQNSAGHAYFTGPPDEQRGSLAQQTYSASLSGEPFSIWAGPVSLAASFEHRHLADHVNNDANSKIGNHVVGNVPSLNGETSVTEGALETVIPIAKNERWAKSWDFTAAARLTDYELSGTVWTWKFGTTYTPIDDIKFRVTYSHDIRAPNLQELFQTPGFVVGSPTVVDPFRNNSSYVYHNTITQGNPNLMPETANTTGIGVILSPSFLPGVTASVDYWDVAMEGTVQPLTAQQEVNLCFGGNQATCSAITRDPTTGLITTIATPAINLASSDTRGLDLEATYRTQIADLVSDWRGNFNLHGLMTIFLRSTQDAKLVPEVSTLGNNSTSTAPPFWKLTVTATYQLDPVTVALTGRAVSAGHIDGSYIECTSGCPVSTSYHQTINNNRLPGRAYMDASLSYDLGVGEAASSQFFLSVKNVFNNNPPPVPTFYLYSIGMSTDLYDRLGTVYRAGIRFKM